MKDIARRADALGVPLDLLRDLLGASEADLARWMAGKMSIEESDVVEVGLSLLELRLARSARQ